MGASRFILKIVDKIKYRGNKSQKKNEQLKNQGEQEDNASTKQNNYEQNQRYDDKKWSDVVKDENRNIGNNNDKIGKEKLRSLTDTNKGSTAREILEKKPNEIQKIKEKQEKKTKDRQEKLEVESKKNYEDKLGSQQGARQRELEERKLNSERNWQDKEKNRRGEIKDDTSFFENTQESELQNNQNFQNQTLALLKTNSQNYFIPTSANDENKNFTTKDTDNLNMLRENQTNGLEHIFEDWHKKPINSKDYYLNMERIEYSAPPIDMDIDSGEDGGNDGGSDGGGDGGGD